MPKSKLNRREFIRLNAAAMAGAAIAPAAITAEKQNTHIENKDGNKSQSPGFYRFAFGEMDVTVLSDGYFYYPPEDVGLDDPVEVQAYGVDPETREEYFRSRRLPTDRIPLQVNSVLIDSGDQRTLVDPGVVHPIELAPMMGRLGHSLKAAGIAPESIDQVLLTHAHADHMYGIMDPADGAPTFPEAEIVISEAEHRFWTGDDVVSAQEPPFVTEHAELLAAAARGPLEALDDRIRIVQGEQEVTDGIWSIPSPGHLPGHTCFAIESKGKQLFLTGDAIAFPHTSFEYPGWHFFGDLDPDEAARTRKRLLDQAVTDEMFILGFHFPFPGLGYAVEHGDAYRWMPTGAGL